jgi:hypothetical protein
MIRVYERSEPTQLVQFAKAAQGVWYTRTWLHHRVPTDWQPVVIGTRGQLSEQRVIDMASRLVRTRLPR